MGLRFLWPAILSDGKNFSAWRSGIEGARHDFQLKVGKASNELDAGTPAGEGSIGPHLLRSKFA
jgi:hypothetical protein